MTKLVKWLDKPVKVGRVMWGKESLLIVLGLYLIPCGFLRLYLLFYLGVIFSVLGHLIFWGPKVLSTVRTMFNKLLLGCI